MFVPPFGSKNTPDPIREKKNDRLLPTGKSRNPTWERNQSGQHYFRLLDAPSPPKTVEKGPGRPGKLFWGEKKNSGAKVVKKKEERQERAKQQKEE